jgi:hypothetical protein
MARCAWIDGSKHQCGLWAVDGPYCKAHRNRAATQLIRSKGERMAVPFQTTPTEQEIVILRDWMVAGPRQREAMEIDMADTFVKLETKSCIRFDGDGILTDWGKYQATGSAT